MITNQIALYYLDNEANVAKTLPVNYKTGTFSSRDLEKFGFGIIPTRRIKSISKLFCLENIIRGGFICYQLYSSYGLYGFLLSKIYHRRISQVTLETSVRLVCMYYSTTTSLFQSILKKYGPQYSS